MGGSKWEEREDKIDKLDGMEEEGLGGRVGVGNRKEGGKGKGLGGGKWEGEGALV